MTKKTEFRTYIDSNGSLPADCVLGNIVWFTVEDANYDAERLVKDFDRLSLNPEMLPHRLNPADAFEKATKKVEGFKYEVVGGNTAEILIREAGRDASTITRHMIREIKDSRGVRLLYEPVGEFVFYKPVQRGGVVDFTSARVRSSLGSSLSPSERDVLTPLVATFEAHYSSYRDFHDGQKIRGVLRNYLIYLNSVQLKPSVYFCHRTRSDELERLKEFADGLGTCSLMLLPQADLPRLRQDIIDAFQVEAEKELTNVIADIAKLRATRSKGIKFEAYQKIKADYDRVMRKASEYSRTLAIGQDKTAGAAELAIESLVALKLDVVTSMEAP